MRGVEDHGRRGLVHFARLDAHQSVLHRVDSADPVDASNDRHAVNQLDERHLDTVDRGRHAAFEGQFEIRGDIRARACRSRERIGILRRLRPRVLEHPALDRTSPEILVGAVGACLRRRHRDPAFPCVLNLLRPVHAPFARWSDNLERRIKRPRRHIQPNLVVALARTTVRDGRRLLPVRNLDELLGDERPAQRDRQWIAVFVTGAGLQCRKDVLPCELLLDVEHVGVRRPSRHRTVTCHVDVRALTQVHGDRDHLRLIVLRQPGDSHRRVQAAGVRQHDALHRSSSLTARKRPRPGHA